MENARLQTLREATEIAKRWGQSLVSRVNKRGGYPRRRDGFRQPLHAPVYVVGLFEEELKQEPEAIFNVMGFVSEEG